MTTGAGADTSKANDGPSGWDVLRYTVSILAGEFAVGFVGIAPNLLPWNAAALPFFLLLHSLVIALPVALFMRARGWRNFLSAPLAWALLGLAPFGALSLLQGSVGESAEVVLWGAAGGLIAWIALRIQTTGADLLPPQFRGAGTLGLGLATLLLAFVAISHLIAITRPEDKSCHNAFRDGGRSVPTLEMAELKLPQAEWPKLQAILKAEATAHGWSLRIQAIEQAIGGSLCRDDGALIHFYTLPPEQWVQFSVYAPRGGKVWRSQADGLFRRLAVEWPAALSFPEHGKAKPDSAGTKPIGED